MKELDDLLQKVGVDKVLHLLVGAWICAMFTLVSILQEGCDLLWWQTLLMSLAGTLAALFLSVIKEIFLDDKPDWKDVLWAFYGCLTVIVAVGIGVLFNILAHG